MRFTGGKRELRAGKNRYNLLNTIFAAAVTSYLTAHLAAARLIARRPRRGGESRPNGMVGQITGALPRTSRGFAHKNAAAWSEAAT